LDFEEGDGVPRSTLEHFERVLEVNLDLPKAFSSFNAMQYDRLIHSAFIFHNDAYWNQNNKKGALAPSLR